MSLPNISDISRKRYETQFSVTPSDPIFSKPNRFFFLTGVEGSGTWTIVYTNATGNQYTRSGGNNQEFLHYMAVTKIISTTNVTRIRGFYIDR